MNILSNVVLDYKIYLNREFDNFSWHKIEKSTLEYVFGKGEIIIICIEYLNQEEILKAIEMVKF